MMTPPLEPAPVTTPDSPTARLPAARRSRYKGTTRLTVRRRCARRCLPFDVEDAALQLFVTSVMCMYLLAAGDETHGPPNEAGGYSDVDENVPNTQQDRKTARSRRSTSGAKSAAATSGRGSAVKGSAFSEVGRMRAALHDAN